MTWNTFFFTLWQRPFSLRSCNSDDDKHLMGSVDWGLGSIGGLFEGVDVVIDVGI